MQGVQVDIFGQRLQVHISLQLNMLSLSARSVGLQLSSLGSRTNAGCSFLEVYQVRFQMAEYAVSAVSATLAPTTSILLHLPLSQFETENNRATYLRCTVPWGEQIKRSQQQHVDGDQQHHDGQ